MSFKVVLGRVLKVTVLKIAAVYAEYSALHSNLYYKSTMLNKNMEGLIGFKFSQVIGTL